MPDVKKFCSFHLFSFQLTMNFTLKLQRHQKSLFHRKATDHERKDDKFKNMFYTKTVRILQDRTPFTPPAFEAPARAQRQLFDRYAPYLLF